MLGERPTLQGAGSSEARSSGTVGTRPASQRRPQPIICASLRRRGMRLWSLRQRSASFADRQPQAARQRQGRGADFVRRTLGLTERSALLQFDRPQCNDRCSARENLSNRPTAPDRRVVAASPVRGDGTPGHSRALAGRAIRIRRMKID
jgi:hypothetical protein